MHSSCTRLAACSAFVISTLSTGTSAAVVSFADDMAGFVAATSAQSIGALPGSGGSGTVVGNVTFTDGPGASLVFSALSNEIPGNDLGISGPENFNATISGGAFAFGFRLHEPTYRGTSSPVNGCNGACVDTTFSIEIFAGNTRLGTFNYNAPDDTSDSAGGPLGFFGLQSDIKFDRVQVRDVTGNIDNEFFGDFLIATDGGTVPEPGVLALLFAPIGGLALSRARRLRRV